VDNVVHPCVPVVRAVAAWPDCKASSISFLTSTVSHSSGGRLCAERQSLACSCQQLILNTHSTHRCAELRRACGTSHWDLVAIIMSCVCNLPHTPPLLGAPCNAGHVE
jgi:hypothetical protein